MEPSATCTTATTCTICVIVINVLPGPAQMRNLCNCRQFSACTCSIRVAVRAVDARPHGVLDPQPMYSRFMGRVLFGVTIFPSRYRRLRSSLRYVLLRECCLGTREFPFKQHFATVEGIGTRSASFEVFTLTLLLPPPPSVNVDEYISEGSS